MNDCVNIKEIIVDGSQVSSRGEFYDAIRIQIGGDLLIGNNLDALHDALTSITEPSDITIIERRLLEQNLADYWEKIYKVLMDCLDENYNLSVSFEEIDL